MPGAFLAPPVSLLLLSLPASLPWNCQLCILVSAPQDDGAFCADSRMFSPQFTVVSYCRVTNDPTLQWLQTTVLFALAFVGQEFGKGPAGQFCFTFSQLAFLGWIQPVVRPGSSTSVLFHVTPLILVAWACNPPFDVGVAHGYREKGAGGGHLWRRTATQESVFLWLLSFQCCVRTDF